MHTQLIELKKERDELLSVVMGLGRFQRTIPGLDLPTADRQISPDINSQLQSGSESISSERGCGSNGNSFSADELVYNFDRMPPAEPIFAYDYNHSSPSRSGSQSMRDSYLCPKKPFQ